MGGLTAAAVLAKCADRRVLVLERHYTAGGLTQSFTRPGYEWDVGVHYVGEVSGNGSLRRPLEFLTEGRLAWAPLPDAYDCVFLGDRSYVLVRGRERFLATLKDCFPGEEAALDRYVELIEKCRQASGPFLTTKALPSVVSRVVEPGLRAAFMELAGRTTADVIGSLTPNRELMAVLTAQYGNYGSPPHQSSFAVHAGIVGHFMEGAYFPVGGAGAIAKALAPTIEAAGGAIYVNAEVETVLVEGGRALGVRMTDGREIRVPIVISDAGVASTFGRLVAREHVPGQISPSRSRSCDLRMATCASTSASSTPTRSSASPARNLGFTRTSTMSGTSTASSRIRKVHSVPLLAPFRRRRTRRSERATRGADRGRAHGCPVRVVRAVGEWSRAGAGPTTKR